MSFYKKKCSRNNFLAQLVRTLGITLLCASLLAGLAPPPLFTSTAYAMAPVVNTTITVYNTGSAPFDGSTWDGDLSNAGLDADAANDVVRLQDSVTYRVEVSSNDSDVTDLTASVQLDTKQTWVSLPSGCKTDPADVTSQPVSSISADGRTLFCNLGKAIEGTKRVFYPTARALAVSSDGQPVLNDESISATVSAQAYSLANGSSAVATAGPTNVTVTADFRVDTFKELKVTARDPDTNEPLYTAPSKTGSDGTTNGSIIEYVIKVQYQKGSMLADAPDEANGDYEIDFTLLDHYTDDNDNNNNGGVSTGALLYNWDPNKPACELIGDHGPNATVSCTQVNHVLDQLSTVGGFGADGVNDPNIEIDLQNIDVRDPDSDTNLVELRINIWHSEPDDIATTPDCPPTPCQIMTINSVGVYSPTANSVVGFNPISTEDASGNNLLNYNGVGESHPEYVTYPLIYTLPGTWTPRKSFFGINSAAAATGKPTLTRSYARGDTIPLLLDIFDYRDLDGAQSQLCDKLDTSQFEYVGLSGPNRTDTGYSLNDNQQYNPTYVVYQGASGSTYVDGAPYTNLLFSAEPHPTLLEQRDDNCDDDINGDGTYVVDGIDVSTGLATALPNDWVTDPALLTNGNADVSKIRWETTADIDLDPTSSKSIFTLNLLVKIKENATGYVNPDGNTYLPNYSTSRKHTGDGVWEPWVTHDTGSYAVSVDPNDANFGYEFFYADRVILAPSSISVAKYTEPRNITIVKGGDIVDFIVEPRVSGAWSPTITTANVADTIPTGTSYILGSERFSIDGGTTWLSYDDYVASSPDVTITTSPNNSAQSLAWNFGDLQTGDQIPLIRYSVLVDPSRISGKFINTVTFTSDIGIDEVGGGDPDGDGPLTDSPDGTSDPKTAKYQLTILSLEGMQVLKSVDHSVYEVNEPFTFDLTYSNLGSKNYSSADFIDILPYNDDGNDITGGLASMREPSTTFNGIYEVTNISISNGETVYATDAASTSIQQDPCHESNQANGYIPTNGDLCYLMYVENGNAFAGGSTTGTGTTTWTQCTNLSTVTCGALTPESITGLRFDVPSVTGADGGHTLQIELSPTGNLGGTPDLDSEGKVTAGSTGDIYTNNFGGRVPEISLQIISNDASVTIVDGSIGDTAWWDADGDSNGPVGAGDGSDTAEPPIVGATVELLDGFGNPIYVDPVTGAVVPSTWTGAVVYTTTTDSSGKYLFENLPSDNYQVRLTPPTGAIPTYDFDGAGNNLSAMTLAPVTNGIGQVIDVADDEAQDFGYTIYDYGDLPDTPNQPTLNASNGAQHFIGAPGNPTLGSTVDGETDGTPTVSADGDDAVGDDEDGITFLTPIMPGQPVEIEVSATISNGENATVGAWLDLDGDGTFSASEYFSVTLTGGTGIVTDTITFTAPAVITDTVHTRFRIASDPAEVGQADDFDGLANSGEVEDYILMSLGDTIWIDNGAGAGGTSGNGIQDGTEQGVPGVTVELLDSNGDVIATTTTGANGEYLFSGLNPGDYTVHIPDTNFQANGPLENYYSSIGADGGDTTDDNDNGIDEIEPATTGISSNVINLMLDAEPTDDGSGPHANQTVDFGFVKYDFGDLPDDDSGAGSPDSPSYNSDLATTTGAAHFIVDGLQMGTNIDSEADGQPDATATGDDTDGTNDDDGVTFPWSLNGQPSFVAGQDYNIDVTATNTTGVPAYLYAFIDFDGDGTFGPGEVISTTVADGSTNANFPLAVSVPGTADNSQLLGARFRLSTDPALTADGLAPDGEVEDYLVKVVAYDLALRKTVRMPLPNPLLPNGKISFDITIFNQNDRVQEIDVTDYIDNTMWDAFSATDNPNGTAISGTTSLAYSWNGDGSFAPVLSLTGAFSTNESVVIPITLTIKTPTSGALTDLENVAEISRFDSDNDPANGDSSQPGTGSQLVDVDSVADDTDDDTVKDDVIDEDGKASNTNDEDDHDVALVPIYDLALTKERSAGQDYAADFSTSPPTASFDISVKNQGAYPAYNVMVEDYVPAGMSIQSSTIPTTSAAGFTIATINPAQVVSFTVVMQLDDLSHGVYVNGAEIASFEDSNGDPMIDLDSLSDNTPGNDDINTTPGIDPNGDDDQNSHNDIDNDRDGSGNPVDTTSTDIPADDRDEDDHDQEVIVGGLALGNRVWEDTDNSGTFDTGEQGIENVLVEIYAVDNTGTPVGAAVITTTTDANGYWMVDNLPPGDYITVLPASNFGSGNPLEDMFSSSDIATSADPENGQENDDNGIGMASSGAISSGVITLDPVAGEPEQSGTEGDLGPDGHGNAGDFFDNFTVDFGFFQYDMGDAPDSYGTTLANDGARHVQDGVTFLGSGVDSDLDGQPDNNAQGDDTLSGNDVADDEDGVTFLTPIMAGEPFTIEVEASAAGFLNSWIDFDGNGTFDAGEQISSDEALTAGTNTLVFTAPASVDDDNLYSRFRFTADSGEVTTPDGEATSGEVEDYALMSLGSAIWLDDGMGSTGGSDANNGTQDGTEAGIPGVVVELMDSSGTVVATTTTDASGEYLFTGLVPDDYTVYLPASNFADGAPLEDHFSSSDPDGTAVDPDNDQDLDDNGVGDGLDNPATNGLASQPVTLALGTEPTDDGNGNQSNQSVDFGMVQYDKGDLPDINVGAAPGDYETLTTLGHDGARHVIVPDVFLGSGIDAESDGQPDVDANGDNSGDTNDEDGVVFTSLLLPGEVATLDVTANVDGYLNAWIDFNGDGDFDDPGEQIAADTPLTAGINNLSTAVPNTALASDLHTRFRFTSDDPAGQLGADGSWDNGEVEDYVLHTLSLGNQVWHDLDDDGVQDVNEPGIDGVTVNLLDPTTGALIATTTTANGGHYVFDNLLSADPAHQSVLGDYVVEIPASNFAPAGPLVEMYNSNPTEADPNADVDVNDNGINAPQGSAIQSGVVTLNDYSEPTQESPLGPEGHGNAADDFSNLTVDFGFYLPVTVGDRVWYDHDQDGLQDAPADEPGVPGIDVVLYDSITGQPVLDAAGNPMTTVTDANGNYLFEELPPGRYHVQFDLNDLPQNYIVTAPHVGTNISIDSNANPSLGVTDSTPFLYSNAEDRTLDMGIMLLEDVRVGDRVWFDDNQDGIQDIGETGVPTVTVTLYDNATGQPVLGDSGAPMTDVTDVGGNYLFEELPPGDYYVQFDLNSLPQNYLPIGPDAGTDDGLDSDADPSTGITPPTGMLNSTEQNLSLDMGIYRLDNVQIGDLVWYDDNRDGVQDAGETGVENVTATLYDSATGMPVLDALGNPLTDVTDANGNYLFEDLPPGDYYVQFDLGSLPQNYAPTQQDAATNDETDSDANPATGATAPTGMLNSGEQDISLDMGIHRLDNVEVGDRVWYDDDRDGVQDPSEGGVPGVTVMLYDATTGQPMVDPAGNPLTAVTDSNGNYLFTELPPGDYYVVFDLNSLPANQTPTVPDMGNDSNDSDANPLTGQTASTGMINSNETDLSLDMGIHRNDNVAVGDRVWYDDNGDGIQDPGEAGVPNVLATLRDTATGQPVIDRFGVPFIELTNANGDYLFDNLPPGDYYVEFQLNTLPAGYVVTQPDQGSDDMADSDADPSLGRTAPTGFLVANSEDLSLDMGIYQPVGVRIGDQVWLDNNQDGIQDGNEAGVPGVTVTLVDSAGNPVTQDKDGNPIVPQVTDQNGNYLFENLPDGDYSVVFDLSTLPANHAVTAPDQTSDQLDSDADPATGETPATGPLTDGDENLDLDMGIYPLSEVQVGDRVWYDNDGDGQQGDPADEPGVFGVIVNLFNADGTPVIDMTGNLVESTATDSDGNYLFENLPAGDYYVEFDLSSLPTSYLPTMQDAGGDDGMDSDADAATGQTSNTGPLDYGDQDLSLDMGIMAPVSVGDMVWYDNDGDGIQDDPADEPGVSDVTVTLSNADGTPVTDLAGNPVGPVVTDQDGNYLFENLPPGDYVVTFDLNTLPDGSVPTSLDSGDDDQQDSDANPVTGETVNTGFLPAGSTDTSLDMGITQTGGVRVGDRVWYDNNDDGIQDDPADEPGVSDVTVTLSNADGTPVTDLAGNPVGPVVTDSDGNYLFENLSPGDYAVTFDLNTLPNSYVPTSLNSGDDDQQDSDANPATGETASTGFLPAGSTDTSLDMGIVQSSSVRIGDRVWVDENMNGRQNNGEPGVPGVTVNLFNADGTFATNMDGNPVTAQVTDGDGNYLFDNLPEGDYYVQFDLDTLPAGSTVTIQDAGNNDARDSDGDPSTGQTATTGNLLPGEQDLSLDLGIYQLASIGDTVWEDLNRDGIQDAGEPGLEGVTVTLFNADGTPATDISGNPVTMVTDPNGSYEFTSLLPGDYYAEFTPPAGYEPSPLDNTDEQLDSDADPVTGQTAVTTLDAGEHDSTLDAGFYSPAVDPDAVQVGNQVWYDNDGDGIQDDPADEPGVPGVIVTLFNADGTPVTDLAGDPVGPVTTDADGKYLFDNLPQGDYYVQFDLGTLPDGYEATAQTSDQQPGTNDQVDSDGDPITGRTETTGLLLPGMVDDTLDLGIVAPVSVGNQVWYDYNGDGQQDDPADEPGVEGVTVVLLNADGTLVTDMAGNSVDPVVTDSNGQYLFDNLPPGDYRVMFDLDTLPTNHVVTQQDATSDELDSDADSATGHTPATGMIPAGTVNDTLDMGILPIAEVSVGDQVWLDNNGDGQQGDPATEPGVPGVTVTLFNEDGSPVIDLDGNPVAPVITDSSGNYLFDNLPTGSYYVQFEPSSIPAGYTITQPNQGDDGTDSDANPNSGQTPPTGFIPAGSTNHSLDMGLAPILPVTVGDRVWYDHNKDGIQDDPATEPGVPGVEVTLFNADGTPAMDVDGNAVAPIVTDSEGQYRFDNLPQGDYYVNFNLDTLPQHYTVTEPNMTSDAQDSDANPSTGQTGTTGFIPGGTDDLSLDMGLVELIPDVRIGDLVWLDEDRNGMQDPGEPGIGGITVMLHDAVTGDQIGIAITDADGNYLFDELYPGDYFVEFDLSTIPANHAVTAADAANDELDSDASPEDGRTPATGILFTGDENLDLDMGLYQIDDVQIGDLVWYDLDGNGIQDQGESGVENVTVTLYDATTNQPVQGVPSQQTDSNGNYLFQDLLAGDYYVGFDLDTLPAGYGVTMRDATSDQLDSDVDPVTGLTASTGLLSGDTADLTLDMGIVKFPGIIIGDTVWFDDNGDGIQDPAEEGVPGITVYLYDQLSGEIVTDAAGEPVQQVTDGDGEYLFEDVDPGQYYVQFDLESLPTGYVVSPTGTEPSDTADSDAAPVTGATPPTALLTYGDSDHTVDMGIYKPIEIGDRVWFDDGNGQQDEDELGVPNVGVMLYDAETGEVIATTTTAENGYYLFENLPPGNYFVGFEPATLPDGFRPTLSNVGNDDGDSDIVDSLSGSLQTAPTGFISSGAADFSLDMGLVQPVEIGDLVWYDDDMDGIQSEGEAGVADVSVTLYDASGAEVGVTTTNSEGEYHFGDLNPSDYYVVFNLETLPDGYVATEPNLASDELDSDGSPASGQTANTGFLESGSVVDHLDLGIHMPAQDLVRVGGQTWEDRNLDGVLDPDERLWPDLLVAVYSQDDPTTPIATIRTDEDGNYLFENLPPGEYFVGLPADSQPDGTLPPRYYGVGTPDDERANSGSLKSGDEALDLDIALSYPGSLSGLAWLDENGDGVQAVGESNLSDITVLLYDATGEVVGETITDSNGSYHFDNLIPGDGYRVEFVTLDAHSISPKLQSDDPAIDSDADPTTRQTSTIFVGSGEHVPHLDAGLYEGGSITNLLWFDLDGNGVQDGGEDGLPNVTVFLFNSAGEVVAETVTDENGRYGFSGLLPDDYYAAFAPPPEMVAVTKIIDQGSGLVRGPLVTLPSGGNVSALDIGFTQPSAIGNYVWLDTDKDGLVDDNEMGLADVTIHLLDEEGNLLQSTTTDSDGRFEFLAAPGNYQLEFIARDGMEFTQQNQGDDSVDSDVDPETGRTMLISLSSNVSDFSHYAGFIVSPTAIQLMSLSATEIAFGNVSGVTIEWTTGTELNTFGFDIYRSPDNQFENARAITDGLILADGGDGVYEFTDTTAQLDQIYSYWLVEVQNDQQTYHYGPARVRVEGLRTTSNGYMLFLPLIEQ